MENPLSPFERNYVGFWIFSLIFCSFSSSFSGFVVLSQAFSVKKEKRFVSLSEFVIFCVFCYFQDSIGDIISCISAIESTSNMPL